MVHAIESYASKSKNNNLISQSLVKALRLLGSSIREAVFNDQSIEARSNMLIGSMLAGVSFGNSPVAGVHALAYPIGGTYHIPHGLSNALVLPHVLRFNSTSSEAIKSYSELAPIIFPEIDMTRAIKISPLFLLKKLVLYQRI